jgi:hypothetical protein
MNNSRAVLLTSEKMKKANSLRTGIILNNIWTEFKSNIDLLKNDKECKKYLRQKFK